jgi:hypothetical protein
MWQFTLGAVLGAVAGIWFYWWKGKQVYQLGEELLKRAEGDVEAAYKHIANYPSKFIAGITGRKQQ